MADWAITKAVIGCAGRWTRMLPATKAIPKVMLPVWNKPVIHHIVQSLALNGVTQIMLVISHGNEAIVDYFSSDAALLDHLRRHGKDTIADELEELVGMAHISFCYQHEQLGTGHMYLAAEQRVWDDPWLAMYGDEIVHPLTIRGMLDAFAQERCARIGVQEVTREQIHRYGSLQLDERGNLVAIVEKPPSDEAPSLLANRGPFVFLPQMFGAMRATSMSEEHGEILLTDTIGIYACDYVMRPYVIDYPQRDTGNPDARFLTNTDLAAYDFDVRNLMQA